MRTKLLKKLRKRAYKEIGMVISINISGEEEYKVGWRGLLHYGGGNTFKDFKSAEAKLNDTRRTQILWWIREKRIERREKELRNVNKYIKKL